MMSFDAIKLAAHRTMADRLSRFALSGADERSFLELRDGRQTFAGVTRQMIAQVLPLTKFRSIDDVERIANDLELAPGVGPANVRSEMSGVFYELALNAVQHSKSAVGEYAVLQHMIGADGEVIYVVGVADCGIGIPASLRRNSAFADVQWDGDAIALATELHITGTGDAQRGLGLDHVVQVVKRFGGNFTIISGGGYWYLEEGIRVEKGLLNPTDRLSGTVAAVTISTPPVR